MQQRAQAQNKRNNASAGRTTSFFAKPLEERVEYRQRSPYCPVKYLDINHALCALSPCCPLSTTTFEPSTSSERFYWLQNIQLDVDFVIIRADVGGSVGTLVWVARRAEGMSENDDRADVLTAQNLTKTLIPLFHSRAMQNRLYKATSGVSKLGAAFASALYRDLTGDESAPKSKDKAARLAFAERVIQSVGAGESACGRGRLLKKIWSPPPTCCSLQALASKKYKRSRVRTPDGVHFFKICCGPLGPCEAKKPTKALPANVWP